MPRALLALVAACGFSFAGCGHQNADGHLLGAPPKPVFVIHGGYLSCAGPWSTPTNIATFKLAKPLLDAAAAASGAPAAFVVTCFGTQHDDAFIATDVAPASRSMPTLQLVDAVKARVAAVGDGAEVVIIGHSYGGWLAMRDTEALAGLAPVRYLATIDPISWPDCPPHALIATVAGVVPAGSPLTGCTTAPLDLADSFAAIDAASGRWSQFYQDRFAFLHSAAINAAGANTRLAYDTLTDSTAWEAHLMINRDEKVWSAIGADLH